MKKTLFAVVLAASMVSGCSMFGQETLSYSELTQQGSELAIRSNGENYVPSVVKEAEIARIAVNTAFHASKPAYERYTESLLAEPAVNNYFAAVEAVDSEEEKRAIYDSLTAEDKKLVDEFTSSPVFDGVMEGLKNAAEPALKSILLFTSMDSSSLLKGVEFAALLTEKEKIALTAEQVLYMSNTVVSAYENYQIISAFNSAE